MPKPNNLKRLNAPKGNMTNDIGTGTRNIGINVPTDEKDFWAKVARSFNVRSIGELHRVLLLDGLATRDPEKAAELREIRRRYYGSTLLVIICASMLTFGGVAVRRGSRIGNTRTTAVRPVRDRSVAGRKWEMDLAA
jgi:hypothetical protein